jgi:xanthine/uracil permease
LIYLIIVISVFLIAYRSGIRKWSAIVLGLIIGWIVLNVCCSPQKILTEFDGSFLPLLYIVIEIATPIIVIIYCVIRILMDTCDCDHTDEIHTEKYKLEKLYNE